ncbi:UDP-2,4-diacetamido-2,4,6-trideoxy-beta-L-altropyranose hydrolase [Oceanimonas sp. MB9]|uniref:UDP-2,4-diacetamido-2,4, 6-trideoxy-beta-L-altropyranose hydrolase n=1 Tax=Oceanimonas sp. MB9 TaxID=2588453 RepID=UPI0013F64080|nr:UDP-2,4-diacetamido-2,4,6-trideoxy-beta-L-altropyranose hydrolase [Oceanimonas sp. MB9]NHI01617.1 UDP-2,4-diacetamido-2,4,6-trideoxy-beta-L-altropyranose hydrolase [Oceanimonas sp. MB9]
MRIVFRADASIQIGTGHVMRCLTLAEELTRQGHECLFICREHKGHLGDFIREKGFVLHLLYSSNEKQHAPDTLNWNTHAKWLGVSWQQDAEQTLSTLIQQPVDWLVVDHYALDARWEQLVAKYTKHIMVIDDLADRLHQCDMLLDQTFGRQSVDYREWVPANCELLCGSQYALLRPEFAELRHYSLQRRAKPELHSLLITMGGVDKDNITGQVLDALRESTLPHYCKITVVMGSTAPWLEAVKQQAETMPWPTEVKVGVRNMAQLMAESDLAIGAAGATAWERCCLGLPSIQVIVAKNQLWIARALNKVRAAFLLNNISSVHDAISYTIKSLSSMSHESQKVTDGKGALKVFEKMTDIFHDPNFKYDARYSMHSFQCLSIKESEKILEMRNHPNVRKWMHNPSEISINEHLNFIENLRKGEKEYFSIKDNNRIIGVLYFTDFNKEHDSCYIGLYKNFNSPQKGDGSVIMKVAIYYAVNSLGLNKIYLEVLKDNLAAIKLYEKFGFEKVESYNLLNRVVLMEKSILRSGNEKFISR